MAFQLQLPEIDTERQAFSDLFQKVPELRALNDVAKSRFNSALQTRLTALQLKLRESHFQPGDPFKLRQSFPAGMVAWLDQFPEKHRLGLLLTVLGLQYLTERELSLFLDITTQKLLNRLREKVRLPPVAIRDLPPTARDRLRVYAVSTFGLYSTFFHRLRIEGRRDRDRSPYGSNVKQALPELIADLRHLAETDESSIYYSENEARVIQFLRSVLDSDLLMLEDASYSGTRVTNVAKRLLRTLSLIISPFTREISQLGYSPPEVYFLVLHGSPEAERKLSLPELRKEADIPFSKYEVIFGHVLDERNRLTYAAPTSLEPFLRILTCQLH